MRIRSEFEGRWFEQRHFLNKPGFHSIAAVLGYIRMKGNWISSELIITDCERKIELDVSLHDRPNRENTAHKLRLLARVCNDMADWIEGPGRELLEQIERDTAQEKSIGGNIHRGERVRFTGFDDY